jgi:hypothetical protein
MKKVIIACGILFLAFIAKKCYFDNYECGSFLVKSNLRYHTITLKKNKATFVVTDSHKEDFNFYVNSNFFTKSAEAIGGVVIDGHKVNNQIPGGGSFVVKKGQPLIVFGRVRKCEYLSQSIIWALKGGEINKRVIRQKHAHEKTMRILIGKNPEGEIIVIHSNPLVLVTMPEILVFAKKAGIKDAIILDSGTSVDLKVSDGIYSHAIKALPTIIKKAARIDEPVTYIAANF